MRASLPLALLTGLGVSMFTHSADDVIAKGQYLAVAGDCGACHSEDFGGGNAIESPVGDIIASNITFDSNAGIGGWSEQQFADALRKGKSPHGSLYPAMPYTSYTGLTDDDVHALYSYLKSVPPVSRKPKETDLGFPFVRPAMMFWNLLNLDEGHPVGAVEVTGEEAERGRYLVEVLGHCTTCHTPRGELMGQLSDKHLAGGAVGGWYAPNITPDKTGIGSWTEAETIQFLKTGHNRYGVAAGEMGLAVDLSLSKLTDDDIAAMVAYLKQVPAVETAAPAPIASGLPDVPVDSIEAPNDGWKEMAAMDTTDGAILYQGACASCHGRSGKGTAGPDLAVNSDVLAHRADNLIQVIAHGVDLKADSAISYMPGFLSEMSHAQIAATANYVRETLAGMSTAKIDQDAVSQVLSGKKGTSWLIANATWLAWTGVAVLVLLILLLLGRLFSARRR